MFPYIPTCDVFITNLACVNAIALSVGWKAMLHYYSVRKCQLSARHDKDQFRNMPSSRTATGGIKLYESLWRGYSPEIYWNYSENTVSCWKGKNVLMSLRILGSYDGPGFPVCLQMYDIIVLHSSMNTIRKFYKKHGALFLKLQQKLTSSFLQGVPYKNMWWNSTIF